MADPPVQGPKADMQLVGDPLFPLQSIAVFFKELQELLVPGILGGRKGGDGRQRGKSFGMHGLRKVAWHQHIGLTEVGGVFDHILELAHIPGPLVI